MKIPPTIADSLCWRDPRSSAYLEPNAYTEAREPRKDCACDPCYSGRDRLAVLLLEAAEALGRYVTQEETAAPYSSSPLREAARAVLAKVGA